MVAVASVAGTKAPLLDAADTLQTVFLPSYHHTLGPMGKACTRSQQDTRKKRVPGGDSHVND